MMRHDVCTEKLKLSVKSSLISQDIVILTLLIKMKWNPCLSKNYKAKRSHH